MEILFPLNILSPFDINGKWGAQVLPLSSLSPCHAAPPVMLLILWLMCYFNVMQEKLPPYFGEDTQMILVEGVLQRYQKFSLLC